MKIYTLLILLLSGTMIYSQNASISPFDTTMYGRNEKVGQYINIRGFNMYYETYGKGAPVLMIHGNGGSISSFLYQINYFSQNYRVIVADSRAQGKSMDTGDSLSYEMMADDLNELLNKLHLASCYVIGWSDGGINGLLLAIRHPDKVKELAITGANLWPDSTALNKSFFSWLIPYTDTLKKMKQTPKVKNDFKVANIMVDQPHITIKQLNNITCPTLVMGGDHDIILPQHTILIAESIPGSYLWILPNSGHATLITYKDQFNETVMNFFREKRTK